MRNSSSMIRRRALALASAAAIYAIAPALYAGVTGDAVTISLSGSTAIRNFTTSDGFSLVNPGSSVSIGGVNYPATADLWSPTGSILSYQLAPFSATGAVNTGSNQAANALRIEWHEQGSVEGILEMANDQIAPIDSITATNRNPTTGNPVWVNRNKFDASPGHAAGDTVSGFQLGAVNTVGGGTTGVAQFNLNGTTLNNSQNAVQMAISDVSARQGFSIAGTSSYSLTPGQAGYGKGNAALQVGATVQGLGQDNVRHQLADATVLNMPAAATNPRTGTTFGAGPWNTAAIDNLDNKTVAITATLFVANPGTGLDKLNRYDAQFLQATGRLANGADFNVATRDVNSGTLNVASLNVGLDPSFNVGENDNGNGNAADGGTTQVSIGPGIRFSNKTSGGSGLRPTVQNSRMAVGHLSMSDAIGSTKQSTSRPLRALSYRDDINDVADNSNNAYRPASSTGDQRDAYTDPASGSFVRPSAQTIIDGSYALYQNETYVTVKKPSAAFAGDTAAQWAARTDASTGIQGDSPTHDVAAFRQNILSSVATFPHPASAASPADALVDKSLILPQFMQVKKTSDGINQSFSNPDYNATLSGQFLGSSLVNAFNPEDPSTVTKGSSSVYGAVTPAGTGSIPITDQNYLFGNFRQNGIRDFEAVKAAQDAQARLFTSGAGVDMFAGGVNSTVITGLATPLAAINATKGDLIVLGDFNSDGRFDGKDIYLMARGAALADNLNSTTLTLNGGTFGDAIRRGVLRKNAALDYMQGVATAQQKIDASANLANDPTGSNAFNKFDVNRDGLVNRNDAKIVDHFVGKDYRVLQDQLDAVVNGAPISLVDVELNDTGDISHAAPGPNDVSDTKLIIFALQSRDAFPSRTGNEHDPLNHLLNGDTNFDGTVDGADFSILASSFGQSAKKWSNGDFNFDGMVDGADFSLLAANFGFTAGSDTPVSLPASDWAAIRSFGQSVPEPSSLGAIALGASALLTRRRRASRSPRWIKRLAALALGATLFTAAHAQAAATTFLNVPISADAITDDPTLANRVTTDMKVTVPAGSDWSNSAIEIVLTHGSVYNATGATATESTPNAALWSIPTLRNGQFDSFVTTKNFGAATILGFFQNGADQPGSAQGLTTADASAIRVSWGDTTLGEDGTFSVGRFTLSNDATGTFSGRSFSSDNPGTPTNFSGTIINGALSVPEPTLSALSALALLTQRRRRKSTAVRSVG